MFHDRSYGNAAGGLGGLGSESLRFVFSAVRLSRGPFAAHSKEPGHESAIGLTPCCPVHRLWFSAGRAISLVALAAVVFAPGLPASPAGATVYSWTSTSTGGTGPNWDANGNWNDIGGSFPKDQGDTAVFSTNQSGTFQVNTKASRTVGAMVFNAASSYNVNVGGTGRHLGAHYRRQQQLQQRRGACRLLLVSADRQCHCRQLGSPVHGRDDDEHLLPGPKCSSPPQLPAAAR